MPHLNIDDHHAAFTPRQGDLEVVQRVIAERLVEHSEVRIAITYNGARCCDFVVRDATQVKVAETAGGFNDDLYAELSARTAANSPRLFIDVATAEVTTGRNSRIW